MTRRASTPRSLPWSGLDPDQRSTLFLYGGIGAIILFALFGKATDVSDEPGIRRQTELSQQVCPSVDGRGWSLNGIRNDGDSLNGKPDL